MQKSNLVGQKFHRLIIIGRADDYITPKTGARGTRYICKCDCGNIIISRSDRLRSGHTKSCGCYMREKTIERNTIHGLCRTKIYGLYCAMIQRCCNEKNHAYKDYGGRGISICSEWLNDFQVFYNWAMASGYDKDLTLERTDVNGNYCPENCVWASRQTQANNRRNSVCLTFNGKTQTLRNWSIDLGIPMKLITSRYYRNWTADRILTTPLMINQFG